MSGRSDSSTGIANPKRWLADVGPGLALCAVLALTAVLLERLLTKSVPLPATVIVLLLGILLNGVAQRSIFRQGMAFCVRTLLRWAVALLGFKVVLGDILSLGTGAIVLVIAAMALTMTCGIWFARLFGQADGFGALTGAACAVCGASATLATSTVVPDYDNKEADIAFAVVAANIAATLGMVFYPVLCRWFGFTDAETGVFLGGTIHDVAQVAGAADVVSASAGNTAIIVKLFRVFLLLPVVMATGWWFARSGDKTGTARVPVPVFALAFLAFCLMNSAVPVVMPVLVPAYDALRDVLADVSRWGLLLAIAALGLGTSVRAFIRLGWRHAATFAATSLAIVIMIAGGLSAMR